MRNQALRDLVNTGGSNFAVAGQNPSYAEVTRRLHEAEVTRTRLNGIITTLRASNTRQGEAISNFYEQLSARNPSIQNGSTAPQAPGVSGIVIGSAHGPEPLEGYMPGIANERKSPLSTPRSASKTHLLAAVEPQDRPEPEDGPFIGEGPSLLEETLDGSNPFDDSGYEGPDHEEPEAHDNYDKKYRRPPDTNRRPPGAN